MAVPNTRRLRKLTPREVLSICLLIEEHSEKPKQTGVTFDIGDGEKVLVLADRLKLFVRDGPRCKHCGLETTLWVIEEVLDKKPEDRKFRYHIAIYGIEGGIEIPMTSDHVKELSAGGSDTMENKQLLCSPCNLAKSNAQGLPREALILLPPQHRRRQKSDDVRRMDKQLNEEMDEHRGYENNMPLSLLLEFRACYIRMLRDKDRQRCLKKFRAWKQSRNIPDRPKPKELRPVKKLQGWEQPLIMSDQSKKSKSTPLSVEELTAQLERREMAKEKVIFTAIHHDMDSLACQMMVRRYHHSGKQEDGPLALNIISVPWFYEPVDTVPGFQSMENYDVEILYLLDVSLTADTKWMLEWLAARAKQVIWIDHHKTSLEVTEVPENVTRVVDTRFAGAVAVYKYFWPGRSIPKGVFLVDDYDMWRHMSPDSRKLNAAVHANHKEQFRLLNDRLMIALLDETSGGQMALSEFIQIGERELVAIADSNAILRKRLLFMADFVVCAEAGDTIPVFAINVAGNSDTFGKYFTARNMVVTFQFNGDGYTYSLYCHADSPIDTSAISKRFGGGGHRNASGFSSPDFKLTNCRKIEAE